MTVSDKGTFLLPPNASPLTGGQDGLFYLICYLSLFFFVLIVSILIYFVFKYRRKNQDENPPHISGNTKLEIFWSVIPTILFFVIFAWGFIDWVKLNVVPQGALEVRVTGKKWDWLFTDMRTGAETSNLIVPVNTPIKLVMTSTDVIHGFYVPDFRINRDVLPSQYTVLWFQAPELGKHVIFCTQYCGTKHSQMLRYVEVVTQEEYEKAMVSAQGAGLSPIEYGKKVFEGKGACASCHDVSPAKKRLVGPPLYQSYGTRITVQMPNGKQEIMEFDDDYLRKSIVNPNFRNVIGYPSVMPPYQGQLNEKELSSLIEYIKSLK
jgi:cytochrome c oxidase subunit 2